MPRSANSRIGKPSFQSNSRAQSESRPQAETSGVVPRRESPLRPLKALEPCARTPASGRPASFGLCGALWRALARTTTLQEPIIFAVSIIVLVRSKSAKLPRGSLPSGHQLSSRRPVVPRRTLGTFPRFTSLFSRCLVVLARFAYSQRENGAKKGSVATFTLRVRRPKLQAHELTPTPLDNEEV